MRYDPFIDRLLAARHKYEDTVRTIIAETKLGDDVLKEQILTEFGGPTPKRKYVKKTGRRKLHWTQRPENKAKIRKAAKKSAATRLGQPSTARGDK